MSRCLCNARAIIVPAATLLYVLSLLNAITPPTLRTTTLITAYTPANSAYLRLSCAFQFLQWKYIARKNGTKRVSVRFLLLFGAEGTFLCCQRFFVVRVDHCFCYFQRRGISNCSNRDCDTHGFSKNGIFHFDDQRISIHTSVKLLMLVSR